MGVATTDSAFKAFEPYISRINEAHFFSPKFALTRVKNDVHEIM